MHRVQVRLTTEQARALQQLAARQGQSVAELIRQSIEAMLSSNGIVDPDAQRQKAIAAAGKLHGGPDDLGVAHDHFLTQDFDR